jgi:hypothetical protein
MGSQLFKEGKAKKSHTSPAIHASPKTPLFQGLSQKTDYVKGLFLEFGAYNDK